MIHAMKEAEATPEIGVIVLRAEGRAFSAGYDLTNRAARPDSKYLHPARSFPTPAPPIPARWSGHAMSSPRTG